MRKIQTLTWAEFVRLCQKKKEYEDLYVEMKFVPVGSSRFEARTLALAFKASVVLTEKKKFNGDWGNLIAKAA